MRRNRARRLLLAALVLASSALPLATANACMGCDPICIAWRNLQSGKLGGIIPGTESCPVA